MRALYQIVILGTALAFVSATAALAGGKGGGSGKANETTPKENINFNYGGTTTSYARSSGTVTHRKAASRTNVKDSHDR